MNKLSPTEWKVKPQGRGHPPTSQSYSLFRTAVLDYWSLFIWLDRCGLFCYGFCMYLCTWHEHYVCAVRNIWTSLRTPDAGLPLLPSRHVPAAVVRRVLRSRRVGAGFSRRGLPGPPPLEGSHHQAHNATTTTTATAHKQTPNPPTKQSFLTRTTVGFPTNRHTLRHALVWPLPSQHARALTFNPSLQSFSGLCYLHTEKNWWRRKGLR